jgi:hypothetical protein
MCERNKIHVHYRETPLYWFLQCEAAVYWRSVDKHVWLVGLNEIHDKDVLKVKVAHKYVQHVQNALHNSHVSCFILSF